MPEPIYEGGGVETGGGGTENGGGGVGVGGTNFGGGCVGNCSGRIDVGPVQQI